MQTFSKIVVFYFVLTAIVRGEEPKPLTVGDAISEALSKNPELRALEARIDSARRGVDVAKTYPFNPELNFEEGLDRHIGVSQTFEWAGKRALREAIAKQDVAAAQAGLEGFKVALAAEVRAQFYELLVAQKQIALRQQSLQAADTLLEVSRKRVEAGFAPVTEQTRAQVEVVKAKREIRLAQKSVVLARASLNLFMGRDVQAPLDPQGELTAPTGNVPLGKLLTAGLERNPELRVQRIELEKRGLAVKLARKEAAPDVSLEVFYEGADEENRAGVGLSVPLPILRTSRPFVAAATAEQREAVVRYEAMQRILAANIQKAHAAFTATRDELALFSPDLEKELETQLAATQQKYTEGQVSFLLLLEMQQTYFDYLREYYDSLANVRTAQSELEKAAAISLEEIK